MGIEVVDFSSQRKSSKKPRAGYDVSSHVLMSIANKIEVVTHFAATLSPLM